MSPFIRPRGIGSCGRGPSFFGSRSSRVGGEGVAAHFTEKRPESDMRPQMADHQRLFQTAVFADLAGEDGDFSVLFLFVVLQVFVVGEELAANPAADLVASHC